ncbi:MAG: endonuclease MutS2, partial [Firmicutes bacterium]|nr:endonuclease MutS2 [Bacillota bacterium]
MNTKSLRKLEFDKICGLLASRASSAAGKERCSALVPDTDLWQIQRMQQETEEAFNTLVKQGEPPFGGIRDLRSILQRTAVGGLLSMGELLMVADTMRSIKMIKAYGKREEDTPERPMLDPLFEGLNTYGGIEKEIDRCIISEEEMDDHASEALASIRRQIRAAQQKVRSQLNDMIHSASYSKMLQDPVVTLRSGRFCLPVKAEYRGSVKGMVHDQSSSGSTLFIEPMAVVVLNNKVAELDAQEKEEIERILRNLSNMVHNVQAELEADIDIMTQLDFIFAKAKLAMDMDAVKPNFSENRVIDLPGARHPLIDRQKVVPIHVRLGGDFTSLIITGPNTGGKTVSLKTLGLLTLMGQAGLHIPTSSRAMLTVVDQVFADIGDEQSIEQS